MAFALPFVADLTEAVTGYLSVAAASEETAALVAPALVEETTGATSALGTTAVAEEGGTGVGETYRQYFLRRRSQPPEYPPNTSTTNAPIREQTWTAADNTGNTLLNPEHPLHDVADYEELYGAVDESLFSNQPSSVPTRGYVQSVRTQPPEAGRTWPMDAQRLHNEPPTPVTGRTLAEVRQNYRAAKTAGQGFYEWQGRPGEKRSKASINAHVEPTVKGKTFQTINHGRQTLPRHH